MRACVIGATAACFHTFTKRCTAVIVISASISHITADQRVVDPRLQEQADAQQHDPLGSLHQPALGVEPERLGLGALV